MLLDLVMIGFGIAGLWIGGNLLVRAASRLAVSFGASVLIIGLTVVAWATSAPELIVSVSAAIQGSSDIAIGNVVGSNIANIGLILGLTAIVFPIRLQRDLLTREIPIMLAVAVLGFVLSLDGVLSQVDGMILFGSFIAYNCMVFWIVTRGKDEKSVDMPDLPIELPLEGEIKRPIEALWLLGGLLALAVGAQLTVMGATSIARQVGISELVIGLTLVAVGTSLPEFAASMVAAAKKQSDIAIGNVVGSNIANILAILGLTAIVRPINVAPNVLQVQMPVVLIFSVALLALGFNRVISRLEGILLVVGYAGFIAVTFMQM